MVERKHSLPVTRRSKLLGKARSFMCYETVSTPEADLALMRLVYDAHPRLQVPGYLQHRSGYTVYREVFTRD